MEEAMDADARLGAELDRIIAGRTVSLVGNAASLLSRRHGREIDEGCVVRMNAGIPISSAAQGKRIDIHCFSNRRSLNENLGKVHWRVRWRRGYFDRVFSVWMASSERELCDRPDQAFCPIALLEEVANRLGAPPSVGMRALFMFSELTGAPLRAFGFDFKKSASFYRQKENRGAHDWDAERDLAMSLVDQGRLEVID